MHILSGVGELIRQYNDLEQTKIKLMTFDQDHTEIIHCTCTYNLKVDRKCSITPLFSAFVCR